MTSRLLMIVTLVANGAAFQNFNNFPDTIYIPKYHDNDITIWNIDATCIIPGYEYVSCDRCAITVEGYSGVCLNGLDIVMSPCVKDDQSQCASWTSLEIEVTCWSSYGSKDVSKTLFVEQRNNCGKPIQEGYTFEIDSTMEYNSSIGVTSCAVGYTGQPSVDSINCNEAGAWDFVTGCDKIVVPLSDGCELTGRCYRSFRKNEEPHRVKVSLITKDGQPSVTSSNCTCKIGFSCACGHTTGVLYQFAKCKLQGLKAIPVDIAKTSQPQIWHVPRGLSIHGKAVQDVIVSGHSKTKAQNIDDVPRTIKSTLYNPVRGQPINWNEMYPKLIEASPDLLVIPALQESNIRYVASKFGPVPHGSILRYQQRLEDNCILNVFDGIGFQELPAANVMMNNYNAVLTSEQAIKLEGLSVTMKEIQRFEEETRLQSQTALWYKIRRNRVTASNIGEIFKRRNEEGPLVQRLQSTRQSCHDDCDETRSSS